MNWLRRLWARYKAWDRCMNEYDEHMGNPEWAPLPGETEEQRAVRLEAPWLLVLKRDGEEEQ